LSGINILYLACKINIFYPIQRLSKQVEVLVEERVATESKTEQLLGEFNDMQTDAKQIEENLHQLQLEELQVPFSPPITLFSHFFQISLNHIKFLKTSDEVPVVAEKIP
jgi:hypothetical protein